jgi:hypothetical protein
LLRRQQRLNRYPQFLGRKIKAMNPEVASFSSKIFQVSQEQK